MTKTFLQAEWRKLAMANYCVDKKLLAPFLPQKTEIDLWKDNCYVSLVGFRFMDTKLKGFKIPFHTNFEEVNLRFYVRYKDNGAWKRGVVYAPALSIDRLEIKYKGGRVLVSPKDKKRFIDDLRKLNPKI